jgi:hypothetical protein
MRRVRRDRGGENNQRNPDSQHRYDNFLAYSNPLGELGELLRENGSL